MDVVAAVNAVAQFRGASKDLRGRVAAVEAALQGLPAAEAVLAAEGLGMTQDLLAGAVLVKRLSAQIDVVLHAVGIVQSLPHVLAPDEVVESLSLGAGNTGRGFDLTTSHQVAEFKFIRWQGGPESVRQDTLLVDVFHLAAADTTKRRVLYLTGAAIPLRFLRGSRRKTREALARRPGCPSQFNIAYGDRYPLVRDYWEAVSSRVEVVDLEPLIPTLTGLDDGQVTPDDRHCGDD